MNPVVIIKNSGGRQVKACASCGGPMNRASKRLHCLACIRDEGLSAHSAAPAAEPPSIRATLEDVWGDRLNEHPEKGYILDGRPVPFDHLMLETNRVLKAEGKPQVGKKREWLA